MTPVSSRIIYAVYTLPIRPTRMVIVTKGSAGRIFGQVSSAIMGPPQARLHVINFFLHRPSPSLGLSDCYSIHRMRTAVSAQIGM